MTSIPRNLTFAYPHQVSNDIILLHNEKTEILTLYNRATNISTELSIEGPVRDINNRISFRDTNDNFVIVEPSGFDVPNIFIDSDYSMKKIDCYLFVCIENDTIYVFHREFNPQAKLNKGHICCSMFRSNGLSKIQTTYLKVPVNRPFWFAIHQLKFKAICPIVIDDDYAILFDFQKNDFKLMNQCNLVNIHAKLISAVKTPRGQVTPTFKKILLQKGPTHSARLRIIDTVSGDETEYEDTVQYVLTYDQISSIVKIFMRPMASELIGLDRTDIVCLSESPANSSNADPDDITSTQCTIVDGDTIHLMCKSDYDYKGQITLSDLSPNTFIKTIPDLFRIMIDCIENKTEQICSHYYKSDNIIKVVFDIDLIYVKDTFEVICTADVPTDAKRAATEVGDDGN
jgi:hypothetical protein